MQMRIVEWELQSHTSKSDEKQKTKIIDSLIFVNKNI